MIFGVTAKLSRRLASMGTALLWEIVGPASRSAAVRRPAVDWISEIEPVAIRVIVRSARISRPKTAGCDRTSRAGMSLPARLSRRFGHCSTAAADRSNRAAQDSPKGQSWRWPIIDSIRLRFARDIVPAPRCGSKSADARRWNADTAVNITGGGGGARIGLRCEVPRGYMARASHGGSCECGGSDQCSRQKSKLSHSISPLDMKSQRRWLLFVNGEMIDSSK